MKWIYYVIPQYVKDEIVLAAFDLFARLSHLTKAQREMHYKNNVSAWEEKKRYLGTDGNEPYIEKQSDMTRLCFGKESASYNACEVIGVYNALVNLNNKQEEIAFPDLLRAFEKKGIALNGAFGTAPKAMAKYLQKRGYHTRMLSGKRVTNQGFEGLSRDCDTFIVTVYNNKENLGEMVHTMCITKGMTEDGAAEYVLHNGGIEAFPQKTLEALLLAYGGERVRPICLIGVAKHALSTEL